MFVLNSDITIGDFRFTGVNEVIIRRSLHNINDTATIKLPSIAKIIRNGKASPETITTGNQFKEGDAVTIKLGYNGELQTEFVGFVKSKSLKLPLEIVCEGFSWLIKRNNVSIFSTGISLNDLLQLAVSGIDSRYKINVDCKADIMLSNVHLNNSTGFEVIKEIAKYTDSAVKCFFIKPDTLWCGIIYTPYAHGTPIADTASVNYTLGYNLVKENSLDERSDEHAATEIRYTKKMSSGTIVSATSSVYKNPNRSYSKILNQISSAADLALLANERAYEINYTGYEGQLSAFLQPHVEPGDNAHITDKRYPEHDGTYLVESTEVRFGIHGARRIVEIGPKSGFAK